MSTRELRVLPVEGLPEIEQGDRLGELIAARTDLEQGDVVVVSQKVVSKAESRVVQLSEVKPSKRARKLAAELGKDPAIVQLVLDECREVIRAERGVLICETRHGLVCANAGVDTSNVPQGSAALLPLDPDASARHIRAELAESSGASVAVVVSDSFGRAWRHGQYEVAIGCAGLRPLDDWRGRADAGGRTLTVTAIAIADEAAAAADLVRDKASSVPAAIVRGLERQVTEDDGPGAAALRRSREEDLFR
ncbi:MAG: coenzyme F420-0:L-glutamate ligase [Actinomycetota bacterium]|nr:coenzyme F420-0:L-glutamate ligase [Actinomycetota bacterium]